MKQMQSSLVVATMIIIINYIHKIQLLDLEPCKYFDTLQSLSTNV